MKLIHGSASVALKYWNESDPQIQLFNLTADPNETNNLAYDYPDIVTDLKEQIDNYQAGFPKCNYCKQQERFDGCAILRQLSLLTDSE